jgi:hypothetical protein
MPLSDRKLAANRANAQKSKGPRTPRGKENSRNSRRKAFLASTILTAHESRGRFCNLVSSFYDEYRPEDSTERLLIEKMAVAHWRLLRMWSLETAGLALETRRQAAANPEQTPPTHTLLALHALSDSHRHADLLGRHERRYDREFYNALAALKRHRNEKNASRSHQPSDSTHPAQKDDPTATHRQATPNPPQAITAGVEPTREPLEPK